MSDGSTVPLSPSFTATGGTISSSGEYTAGSTAGTYRVIATDQASGKADTSSVTITAPPATLQAVVLTPTNISLAAGATQQFVASGRMTDGSTSAVTVAWSAAGGTISSTGLYTAGQTAGAFRVIAAQSGGTLADTATVTVTASTPSTAACTGELRTVNVSTASQLLAAVGAALPGDCITMAAGTYNLTQTLNQSRGGTAANPVTITGAGPANTIVQGTPSIAWYFVTGANYVQMKNFRLTNFFYGPIANPDPYTSTGGRFLVFDGMEIDHNQQQGISPQNGASNGIVRNSYIHHMGLALNGSCGPGQFGEGVYIGGHGANTTDWQVLNNRFDNVTAEAVDNSPGSHRTLIEGNTVDGSASVFFNACTTSLIASYGDDVVIRNNTLVKGNPHGISLYAGTRVLIRGNHIDLQNIHNFTGSLGIRTGGWGATVGCDNVVTNIPAGGRAYDVACTP
jgi:hypothetical protein